MAEFSSPFPSQFTWLPSEGPVSAYQISWEVELAKIYAIHPDWVQMLRAIDGRSLMTDTRWAELLTTDHRWRRRLGARWRR